MVTINKQSFSSNKQSFSLNKQRVLTGFIFVLLIGAIIILLFYVFGLFREVSRPITPSPSPTVEPSPTIKRLPSSIATESGFLKLEEDLKLLEWDLSSVDLSEPKLSLPILELNINFEK